MPGSEKGIEKFGNYATSQEEIIGACRSLQALGSGVE